MFFPGFCSRRTPCARLVLLVLVAATFIAPTVVPAQSTAPDGAEGPNTANAADSGTPPKDDSGSKTTNTEATEKSPPEVPAGTASTDKHPESYLDFALAGGYLMIPIGLASLLLVTFLAERLFATRRGRVIPRSFQREFYGANGKPADSGGDDVGRLGSVGSVGNVGNVGSVGSVGSVGNTGRTANAVTSRAGVVALCERAPTAVSRVVLAANAHLEQPFEEIDQAVNNAAQREIHGLRKYVRLFAIIAAVTPLLGLLGTVTGMIQAFREVALEGLGSGQALAPGIYKALVTTAAGLIVAIPALVVYHWLNSRIDNYVHEIDMVVVDFIDANRPRRRVATESA